ncbi:hypothetical protein UFOVP1244_110 [uncultured Caudovirales phage]|uniref:Uncharacterized protein n=1 Tax=uncultured Caudovirales phage TaxID=2100421 RepID=A0A6J5RKU2_9CAUD|nr:hypothetical protein UFOVP1244_110 [uncultured Caudovirales phage]
MNSFSQEQEIAIYSCACALSALVTAIAQGLQLDYDSPVVHFARERLWQAADSLPDVHRNFFLQFEREVA